MEQSSHSRWTRKLWGILLGTRGLCQGDPISPYLFILVLQNFFDRLHHGFDSGEIVPHQFCTNPLVTHLAFVDNLFIFSRASSSNAAAINSIFYDFSTDLGLFANLSKSSLFFGNSPPRFRLDICRILGMYEGLLSITCLGAPHTSKKLKARGCQPLLDAISSRISSWKAKFLSYVGQL